MGMKLKICGLKFKENIKEVLESLPDYVGFIFYEKSPRFVGDQRLDFIRKISRVKKVGVFVNSDSAFVLNNVEKYGLDLVQLHGDETIGQVQEFHTKGLEIIKVFSVTDRLPENWKAFRPFAKYFLFDTQTAGFGGSGQQFDWSILQHVTHPFFLSGGIQIEDIEKIRKLQLSNLVGVDVNSRFELSPGMKDIDEIKKLKKLL